MVQGPASSARGLLGACFAGVDKIERILSRLTEARRSQVLRIPLVDRACVDDRPARPDFASPPIATVICGPKVTPEHCWESGAQREDSLIVCIDGHLVGPMDGNGHLRQSAEERVRSEYLKYGPDCFGQFDGNFAVVVYDLRLSRLFVARDLAGSKPLFFSFTDHLIFGSSAIEVLRASGLRAVGDERALYRYLVQGTIAGDERTMLQGVRELGAAQYMEIVPGHRPEFHRIALPAADSGRTTTTPFLEAADTVRSTLLKTVHAQTSGLRIGVALSGGIDSSGIVASVRRMVPPQQPIDAFTFAHSHPSMPNSWNELPWAELSASHARAILHPVTFEASRIPQAMSTIFREQDFPFGSPVVLAQAEVFRVAAERGAQAILNGHGPDIIFGGGHSHVVARASSIMLHGDVLGALRFARGASNYTGVSPARLLLTGAYRAWPTLHRFFRKLRTDRWARKKWFDERSAGSVVLPAFESADPMRGLILEQLRYSVVPTSLQMEDCNARAHGLENLLPYLTPSMIRLADALPTEYLVSDQGMTKRVLRQALRSMVPDAILERERPVGFAVPVLPWLHELKPWVDGQLGDLRSLPFYRETPTAEIWAGLAAAGVAAERNAFRIWRWITLLQWAKTHNVSFA